MTINNKITDGHIVTISYMDIVISTTECRKNRFIIKNCFKCSFPSLQQNLE